MGFLKIGLFATAAKRKQDTDRRRRAANKKDKDKKDPDKNVPRAASKTSRWWED